MAIPTNYIYKFTDKDSGESRIISPAADKVRVDNENFEGEDLDEVLNEISDAIAEAGSGGYAPPPGGIPATDLAPAVQTSLGKADTAYQKPASGIPASDIAPGVIPDVSGLATKTEVNTGLAGKVDKETGKSLMSEAEHTKLQNLPTAAELDEIIDGIEAGETVVVNSDGANIVDEHDNNSVLLAPSARQMKLMYNNVMALYNALANTAFVSGKPTLDWVGSKTKYTLSYGTLTGCTADVAAGQVNEGALRIKLTPTSSAYAFTQVTVNGNSVQTTSANDGLGSVYIDIIVNGDITVAATAISGRAIIFSGSTGCTIDDAGVSVGQDLDTIIRANEHYTLPASITVKIGTANVTHTYTRASGNKTATLHIDAANITGNLTITCTAEAMPKATITFPQNRENMVIKHGSTLLTGGSVDVYEDMLDYDITFEPASGYKFTDVPKVNNVALPNSGNVYTLSVTSVSANIAVTATVEQIVPKTVSWQGSGFKVYADSAHQQEISGGSVSVNEGEDFEAYIVANKLYTIDSVSNATYDSSTGKISIANVSADVVIVVTTSSVNVVYRNTLLTQGRKGNVVLLFGDGDDTSTSAGNKRFMPRYSASPIFPLSAGDVVAFKANTAASSTFGLVALDTNLVPIKFYEFKGTMLENGAKEVTISDSGNNVTAFGLLSFNNFNGATSSCFVQKKVNGAYSEDDYLFKGSDWTVDSSTPTYKEFISRLNIDLGLDQNGYYRGVGSLKDASDVVSVKSRLVDAGDQAFGPTMVAKAKVVQSGVSQLDCSISPWFALESHGSAYEIEFCANIAAVVWFSGQGQSYYGNPFLELCVMTNGEVTETGYIEATADPTVKSDVDAKWTHARLYYPTSGESACYVKDNTSNVTLFDKRS